MRNKINSIIFLLNIYIKVILLKNVLCSNSHEGKCVFISSKSGSEIINFHKFKNNKHKFYQGIINDTEKEKWSINLCNDTIYTKYYNDSNNEKLAYDSQIVYTDTDKKRNYILTGAYHKYRSNKIGNESIKLIYIKNNNQFIYQAQSGHFCDEYNSKNYKTSIVFEGSKVTNEKYAEIFELPDINKCDTTLKIHYNEEYSKDYLILQKVLNDEYIFTGTIFILLGIYLCLFSYKFIYITKIAISIIFSQIIIFIFEITFLGNTSSLKGNLFILIITVGASFGCFLGYLSLKSDKFYLIMLAFSSGFINGICVFDLCFIGTNCRLTIGILIDAILIFTISFISLMQILPKNHIYYPPIIGSFILIRGISLFLYKINDKMGYGDLQLLLYLTRLNENDLVEDYLKNDYKYFWVYIIFNAFILILSEISIYFLNKKNEEAFIEDEDIEEENNAENENENENDNTTELANEPLNINDNINNNEQME